MGSIHVRVVSGLASRLRVVLGAIGYAEATGKDLVIYWSLLDHSETSGVFPVRLSELWRHPYVERNEDGRWPCNLESLATAENPYVQTCHFEPFAPWLDEPLCNYMSRLTPTDELQWIIDEQLARWRRPTVGVNIRHALKQPSAADVEWFVRRVSELRRIADFSLYASLDDQHTELQLTREFQDIRGAKIGSPYLYDRAGIMRTAADLYLLARCDWVLGSNHSSYSQLVALMRGAEYRGPHDRPGGLNGGRYEDMWNFADDNAFLKAITDE